MIGDAIDAVILLVQCYWHILRTGKYPSSSSMKGKW